MNKEKGTIVIIASITTTILMILSAYFLNSLIVEMKMSESMNKAEKAYYLAEGGINEAIWKLKNNPEWEENFINPEINPDSEGNFWSDSFIQTDLEGGSYEVEVKNSGLGQAQITSRAKAPFLGREAKREARVTVFKPLDSPTEEAVIFSGGSGSNVQISDTVLVISGGNIFSNHNLIIGGDSQISLFNDPDTQNLEGLILATQNINIQNRAELKDYEEICSKNICTDGCQSCPPEEATLPMVDFDSDSENSFYSRADRYQQEGSCSVYCQEEGGSNYECSDQCIFSSNDFEDLLWKVGEDGVLTLENEVTYVTGSIELRGARNLDVEGALIADGSIDLGMRSSWNRGGERSSGPSNIKVTQEDGAAGILSKKKINFGNNSLNKKSVVEGVVYSGDQVNLSGISEKLVIEGGVIGRQLNLSSLREGLEINFDNELILYGLGYIIDDEVVEPTFSPVIEVDHWEEVY